MRIILGLAISLPVMLLAQPAALAQQAKAPEPMPHVIPGTVGQGPLTLTSSAAVTYQEYFAHGCPLVLTVDAFGWATHAALNSSGPCPETVANIPQKTIRGALNACDTYAHNPPCSVIAVGRKIVWDGPIGRLDGRYAPQGDNQYSIILRKIVPEGEESPTYETSVGLITYGAAGRSGNILFKGHYELGLCRGSLSVHDSNAGTIALTCTKAGAITGSVTLSPDGRTGAGTATDKAQHQFMLKVLPHPEFMNNGMTLYQPPAETGDAMVKPAPKGTT